jgi:hypothetical protein
MKWIRRNTRSGTWLALMALALHMVMTFGHIHAEQFSPASQAAASIVTADGHADDDADAAAERYHTLRAHHHCAICASIGLLGTSTLPAGQALALPRAILGVREPNSSDPAPPHERRSSFKARAPPSA